MLVGLNIVELVERRDELQKNFNEVLLNQEFRIKFWGDNEFEITRAPRGDMYKRLMLSFSGMLLVTVCLVTAGQIQALGSSVSIGGALLGIVLTGTPLIGFYSKSLFKISFSGKLQQLSIQRALASNVKHVNFSNINYIVYRKTELDELSMSEPGGGVACRYDFSLACKQGEVQLFSIKCADNTMDAFVADFAYFLSRFVDKESRALL